MHEGVRELISGSVGGIVSCVAGHPLDTVKTRVQAFPHLYRNSLDCCAKIVRNEGARALGKGLLPPVLAQAGINSVLFASEGTARRSLQVEMATCISGLDLVSQSESISRMNL